MDSPRPPREHSRFLRALPWAAAVGLLALVPAALTTLSGCGPGLQSLFGRGYGYGYGEPKPPQEGLSVWMVAEQVGQSYPLNTTLIASSPWYDWRGNGTFLTTSVAGVVYAAGMGPGGRPDLGFSGSTSFGASGSPILLLSQGAFTIVGLIHPNFGGGNNPGVVLKILSAGSSMSGAYCWGREGIAQIKVFDGVSGQAGLSVCDGSAGNNEDATVVSGINPPLAGGGLLFVATWSHTQGPGMRLYPSDGSPALQNGTNPSLVTSPLDLSGNWFIGEGYSGGISELLIYNRLLSPTEGDQIRQYIRFRYGGNY